MKTCHTEPTQINDFNRIAQKHGFESIEISDELRDEHAEQLNTEHEQAEAVNIDASMLSNLLRPTFDMVCPNWQIRDDEISALVQVYTPVLDKYNVGQYFQSVEFNAVLVTIAIFYSRRGVPLKIINQEEQEEQGVNNG